MVYQPIFARLSDSAGRTAQTSSCRGIVEDISVWINSRYGKVASIGVHFNDGKRRVSRPQLANPSHFPKAEREAVKAQNKKRLEQYEAEVDRLTDVTVSISPEFSDHFRFRIAGIEFSGRELKLLQTYKEKDMLGCLSIAAAFALIPDIVKVVDEPSEANTKAFIEKRDRLDKFFKDEDEKLKQQGAF